MVISNKIHRILHAVPGDEQGTGNSIEAVILNMGDDAMSQM
jgi:hypothetical protein